MTGSRFFLGLLIALGGLLPASHARTLTAADGRSIDAEVLGFEGENKVKIKRADTGQTFTLPISSFSESDRTALLAEAAEAAKKAAVLPPGAVALELSRAPFATRREKRDIELANGGTRRGGLTVIEEDWGYTLTLRNTTPRPIESLRGEYILFVKVDTVGDSQGDGRLKRSRHKITFDPIPIGGRVSARTETITARKTDLAPGLIWRSSGDDKTRDTLHGIWLRVYQGDTLVLEEAKPGTLSATENWDGSGTR